MSDKVNVEKIYGQESGIVFALGSGGFNLTNSVRGIITPEIVRMIVGGDPYGTIVMNELGFRYADTNNNTLLEVDVRERILLGKSGQGSKRSAQYVIDAFEAATPRIAAELKPVQWVFPMAALGKRTGLNTIRPFCHLARKLKKLVVPVVALPSADKGEVTDEQHDQGRQVIEQLKADGFRVIVILNDRAYTLPGSYDETYEQLNLQFAKGLRALIWGMLERKQADDSDFAQLVAGGGYARIGYVDLPKTFEASSTDLGKRIRVAVETCFKNPFYGFTEGAKIGDNLFCIQGGWEMTTFGDFRQAAIAKINLVKATKQDNPYFDKNPISPMIINSPRVGEPWGMMCFLTEFTGIHEPADLDWSGTQPLALKLAAHNKAKQEATGQVVEPQVAARLLLPDTLEVPVVSSTPTEREEADTVPVPVPAEPLHVPEPVKRPKGPFTLADLVRGVNTKDEPFFLTITNADKLPGPQVVKLEPTETLIAMAQPNFRSRAAKGGKTFSSKMMDEFLSVASKSPELMKIKPDWMVEFETGVKKKRLSDLVTEDMARLSADNSTDEQSVLVNWLKTVAVCYDQGLALRFVVERNSSGEPAMSDDNALAAAAGLKAVTRK